MQSRTLADLQELAFLAASDARLTALSRVLSPNPASERAKYAGFSEFESKSAHALAKIRRDFGIEAFDEVVKRAQAQTWPVGRQFIISIFRQFNSEMSAMERCINILDRCPKELVESVNKSQLPGANLLELSEKLRDLSVQVAMKADKFNKPLPR